MLEDSTVRRQAAIRQAELAEARTETLNAPGDSGTANGGEHEEPKTIEGA